MKRNTAPLVDEHLQSVLGMQEAGTDDFFYTRLRARMQRDEAVTGWGFALKPVWVIGCLVLLLAINGVMLAQNSKPKKTATVSSPPSLQGFAESYDQNISSSY